MWQLCGYDRVDISLTVPSSAVLKIVKSMCNGTKKNQIHTYEMSYNCHVYPPRRVATYIFVHSCHTYLQLF
jgi:hypothetical protein